MGLELETIWKENYVMDDFINEYKNRGGRVIAGADSGYMYNLYGFGYIQELELLREAGFHPMEVSKSSYLTCSRSSEWKIKLDNRNWKTCRSSNNGPKPTKKSKNFICYRH